MTATALEEHGQRDNHLTLVPDSVGQGPYWTPVVIRPAVGADTASLRRLAHLDSARPLRGGAILAEQAGVLVAAIGLDDDRAIADPFRASGDLVALLRLRAKQLRAGAPVPAA